MWVRTHKPAFEAVRSRKSPRLLLPNSFPGCICAYCLLWLAWVFVVLGDSYDLETHSWNPDGIRVIRQQDFWFAFVMTILYARLFAPACISADTRVRSILIPWFTVREVAVDIEVVSTHNAPPAVRPTEPGRSRLRKLQSFAWSVGCSRVSWREYPDHQSWSTTPLVSFRECHFRTMCPRLWC